MSFQSLLIANRGEIALRIERSARRLGLETVAVYTAADRNAPHVSRASRAFCLGEDPNLYLDGSRLIAAALATGAEAVHPGYGFLAENAEFAQAARDAGLIFVGPAAAAIARLGDKAAAKELAAELGIPCVPGSVAAILPGDADSLEKAVAAVAFPLLIKAAAGGGGRGMRVVESAAELGPALATASSEATAAFGRGDLLLESFLRGARHVEVQVLADRHGRVIHLGERDCSVQRRFQKLIEESPSPGLGPAQREQLGEAAVSLIAAAAYEGAATVELLLLPDGRFYFLEVNTRLQVEHGVTELRYGLDLVEWQLRIAAGERLPWTSAELKAHGHAIEVRLCAEDPAAHFLPQTGKIVAVALPSGIRVDHALEPGLEVGPSYDSMLAKILCHGRTRQEALQLLTAALDATFVAGLTTNKHFLLAALASKTFRSGGVSTRFVEEEMSGYTAPEPPAWLLLLAAAWQAERKSPYAATELWAFRSSGQPAVFFVVLEVSGKTTELRVEADSGRRYRGQLGDATAELRIISAQAGRLEVEVGAERHLVQVASSGNELFLDAGPATFRCTFGERRRAAPAADPRRVVAPMSSRVKKLQIGLGEAVEPGQPLLILEAMKLEHRLEAQIAGRVAAIHVKTGEAVEHRQLLIEIS